MRERRRQGGEPARGRPGRVGKVREAHGHAGCWYGFQEEREGEG